MKIKKPSPLPVVPESIPDELKPYKQWLCWKYKWIPEKDKWDKPPYNPKTGRNASSNNSKTWTAFDFTHSEYRLNGYDGIGFVPTEEDPYTVIDLDDCRDPETGNVEQWAEDQIKSLNTYTELSPSGKGFRLIGKAKKPNDSWTRCGNVEIYDSNQYLTITGQHVSTTPTTIEDIQKVLDDFIQQWPDEWEQIKAQQQTNSNTPLDQWSKEAESTKYRPTQSEIKYCSNTFTINNDAAISDEIIDDIISLSPKYRSIIDEDPKYSDVHFVDNTPSEWDQAQANILASMGFDNQEIMDAIVDRRNRHGHSLHAKHKGKYSNTFLKARGGIINSKLATTNQTATLIKPFPCTDSGNGERLVALYGNEIRYCHHFKRWYIWDGTRWKMDTSGKINYLAKLTARSIHVEASNAPTKDKISKLSNWALASESDKNKKAMISSASSEPEIPVDPKDLDVDQWLFNVKNGTIDLKTGKLQSHDPKNLITKISPAVYNPQETCPEFLSFLDDIMDGNGKENKIEYIQRAVGYALTGDTSEECIFLLYGKGANGKSTLLTILRALLGDYAMNTDFSTFLVKSNDAIRNDIARLFGARFVSATEAEEGSRFSETLLKQITGRDVVTARFLRREFFEFVPRFKIFLAANHLPEIRGNDHAIWRRIKLIDFNVTIAKNDRDTHLSDRIIKNELPGILNWALEGLKKWRDSGLGDPDEIIKAVSNYRQQMDNVARFVKNLCEVGPNNTVTVPDLYAAYSSYCDGGYHNKLSKRKFGDALTSYCRDFEDCEPFRNRKKDFRFWQGISIKKGDAIFENQSENDEKLEKSQLKLIPGDKT